MKWIRVKDAYPLSNIAVLILIRDMALPEIASYDGRDWIIISCCCGMCSHFTQDVTHWTVIDDLPGE